MDQSYILDEDGRSKLFIHTFDREHDDLFVAGLFEPAEGGVWQLADYQVKLIASFIVALASDPKLAAWFRKLKATATPDIGHGIPDKDTPWQQIRDPSLPLPQIHGAAAQEVRRQRHAALCRKGRSHRAGRRQGAAQADFLPSAVEAPQACRFARALAAVRSSLP